MITSEFLNIDLDLISEHSLRPLLEALGPEVSVMRDEQSAIGHEVSLELGESTWEPDTLMKYWFEFVEGLPAEARAAWDGCVKRVFNIGYEAGRFPRQVQYELPPATLKTLSALGATLATTIYGYAGDDG